MLALSLGLALMSGAGCTATPGHCYTDGLAFDGLGLEGCDGGSGTSGTSDASDATTVGPTGTEPATTEMTLDSTSSTSSGSSSSTAGTASETTTTTDVGVCGDGLVEGDEECDDGDLDDLDECSNACALAVCGDGLVQQGDGLMESCEPPGEASCGDNCVWSTCNNGALDPGEECDPSVAGQDEICEPFCMFTGGARSIALGDAHSCALLWGGAVRCWGEGSFGRLGLGDSESIGDSRDNLPYLDVDFGFDDPTVAVEQITAGGRHSCALTNEGAIYCWGDNAQGQLGYGNTENVGDDETPAEAGPVPLPGAASSVMAGDAHTCAIMKTGGVVCWGRGAHGQLGLGSTDNLGDDEGLGDAMILTFATGTPVGLAVGGDHTCVLLASMGMLAVNCWGRNGDGQLGRDDIGNFGDEEGETAQDSAAIDFGPDRIPQTISAGSNFTCALLQENTEMGVLCWGAGADGRLGHGSTENIGDSDMHLVLDAGLVSLGGDADQVSAGGDHVCATLDVDNDGQREASCWGRGGNGRLGYGDDVSVGGAPDNLPEMAGTLALGDDPLLEVVAGGAHTCARYSDGEVLCWGAGSSGQLGAGSPQDVGNPGAIYPGTPVPLDP